MPLLWVLVAGVFVAERPALASKLAVVSRGIGPGSEKAAALVGHFAHEAFATDERYELVRVTEALGNPERDRALRNFSSAEGLFQKARGAYARLDLDVADDALRSTLARYERHAGYVHDYKKVAEALMLLGAVRILRGDERAGTSYLEQAINVFPDVEPDPRIFNPAMRIQFGQTATRLAARANGTLSLNSAPAAASVYLDGRFVGVTPVVAEGVTEGRHYVRVERDGYRPWGKVVSVGANGETTDSAQLRPTARFEDFDAVLERAARSLDDGGGQGRAAAVMELGSLLGAEEVFLTEVRLDGERVRIAAQQHAISKKGGDKHVQHVFAYEPRIETYEREVGVLLRASFGYGQGQAAASMTTSQDPGAASADFASEQAGRGARTSERPEHLAVSKGHSPHTTKLVVASLLTGVGAGAIVGGAAEWLLAKRAHSQWQRLAQVDASQLRKRADGRNHALAGDVLVSTGAAVLLGGILTWRLWHPDVTVENVGDDVGTPDGRGNERGSDRAHDRAGERTPGRLGDHTALNFSLGVAPISHGALLLPTWNF